MKTISFYSEKGGTGKTALNILLASYLAYDCGKKVIVFDLDYPGYHLYNLRKREMALSEDEGNEKLIDKYVPDNIYSIIPLGNNDNINDIIARIHTSDADYIIIDLPGSLSNPVANKFITSGVIKEFYLPTELDTTVIVSNIKLATQLQKFADKVEIVFNKAFSYEKPELYEMHSRLIHEEYGITVNPVRIRNSIYLRRELGRDDLFVKSTLCYPSRHINKKINELSILFNKLK